jgi:hypothetical protein
MSGRVAAVGETTLAIAAHKRWLSRAIRECFANVDHPVAFLCECAAVDCSNVVWLPMHEYGSGRDDRGCTALATRHATVSVKEAA